MTVGQTPGPIRLSLDTLGPQHSALKMGEFAAETATESSIAPEDPADNWEPDIQHLGMRIAFRDLEYVVRNKSNRSKKLSILRSISGFYLPAEMAAVMGPSGSGQS